MVSLQEARSTICAQVSPLDSSPVPLTEARGRVLGSDIISPEDFPAFDRSAMDGYAISGSDTSQRFRVLAEVRPGDRADFELHPGECARIFTGGRLPGGASHVVMQEDAAREGEFMTPLRLDAAVSHVRRRGEDARRGDRLLRAGTRLQAPELALLAQAGFIAPPLITAPRVMHLATGEELVDPSLQPGPGQIRDSNSTLVGALLAEAGARLVHQTRCGDTLELLVNEVSAAPEHWDLLLISGGASVGDYDFGARALTELGFQIHFRSVNLRPGKPMIFATRGRQVAFVIPGNPVSHFVVFHTAIRLALECLENAEPEWSPVDLPIIDALSDQAGPRDTYWPARVDAKEGRLHVRPLAWRSSGDLCGLAGANALIERLAGSGPIAAGTHVRCRLLH
ncbi:MAG: Molybdenum cofactor synthesis domain protein [Chthoniobacteraceae bacterium]|nr:Molybdenum cofactor synthesis domain protein [Chthoniobacteraceae bacterium]